LEQKLRPFGINAGRIDTSNPCVPCCEKIESFLIGGIFPPKKKSISLRPLRFCGENPFLAWNSLKILTPSGQKVI
jgi:hypothetical protein